MQEVIRNRFFPFLGQNQKRLWHIQDGPMIFNFRYSFNIVKRKLFFYNFSTFFRIIITTAHLKSKINERIENVFFLLNIYSIASFFAVIDKISSFSFKNQLCYDIQKVWVESVINLSFRIIPSSTVPFFKHVLEWVGYRPYARRKNILGNPPNNTPCLVLVSLLKVGIPPPLENQYR